MDIVSHITMQHGNFLKVSFSCGFFSKLCYILFGSDVKAG